MKSTYRCRRSPVPLKGTFLSLWLVQNWDDATWDKELTAYREVGMEYVIFSPAVMLTKEGKMITYYPSAQAEFSEGYVGVDVFDRVLSNCARYGLKCFLGTVQDDFWWELWWDREKTLAHYDWFLELGHKSNRVACELWNRYGSKYPGTFYGWYLIPEIWNFDLLKADAKGRNAVVRMLADGFGVHLDYLSCLTPHAPALTSPFANMNLGSVSDLETQWCDMVRNIPFRRGDILCPQDSIGAGGTKLHQLDAVMQVYVKAVSLREGMVLWANNEDFDQTCWSSAMMDRFVRQMEITAKYAAVNITFAYNNYQSPVNVKPCFHEAMLRYEETGVLPCETPDTPTELSAQKEGEGWRFTWKTGEKKLLVRAEVIARIQNIGGEGLLPEQTAAAERFLGVVHCGFCNNAPKIPELPDTFFWIPEKELAGQETEIRVILYDVYGTPSLPASIRLTL